jgi:hypothetical protein
MERELLIFRKIKEVKGRKISTAYNTVYAPLGFHRYIKRITPWQGSYQWVGKRPRYPLRSVLLTVVCNLKK